MSEGKQYLYQLMYFKVRKLFAPFLPSTLLTPLYFLLTHCSWMPLTILQIAIALLDHHNSQGIARCPLRHLSKMMVIFYEGQWQATCFWTSFSILSFSYENCPPRWPKGKGEEGPYVEDLLSARDLDGHFEDVTHSFIPKSKGGHNGFQTQCPGTHIVGNVTEKCYILRKCRPLLSVNTEKRLRQEK